ncbi:MauE/DoxX family redox-associated membrane protein [Tundrisphaera sp. TA3]|uniref:MauE/DoxX family redox-associated membrane protein n=1 Tax=Tundrisphaera sp. TA3 TaxID=3435775 RepID=UPI003EC0A092
MNAPEKPIVPPNEVDRDFARFRAIACGATLAMIAASWPLWADRGGFPRVPFVAGLPGLPARWPLAVALGAAMLGRAWRPMLAIAPALLVVAILGDQNRFQPWAYQFALYALVMGLASKARALALSRLLVASLYFYSGLSKLDASFVAETGSTFLDAGLVPLGIDPGRWPTPLRVLAILAMPAWEMAVAIGLMRAGTRRLALAGAIGQHLALLGLLGPWALGHSLNVLIWNAAMIAEDVVLFARPPAPAAAWWRSPRDLLATPVVGAAILLPLGEPFGWSDAWPSHALYASHCERIEILIHEEDADRYPAPVRTRLGPADVGGWRRLDLTGWSRDLRGTPVYPQNRVGLGIAGRLAETPGGIRPIRVIEWGRAGRFDGHRDRVESVGLRAIRKRAERHGFGAQAAPG